MCDLLTQRGSTTGSRRGVIAPPSILHHGRIYVELSSIDRLDYSGTVTDGAICVDFQEKSHKTNDQRSTILNIFFPRSRAKAHENCIGGNNVSWRYKVGLDFQEKRYGLRS